MTSHSIALVLLAVAIPLSSRSGMARKRLACLNDRPTLGTRLWRHHTASRTHGDRMIRRLLTAGTGVLTAAVVGGLTGLAAGTVVAVTVAWFLRRARRPPTADPLTVAATWDLLAACLKAGLPVPTAIRAVAGELPTDAAEALRGSAKLLGLGAAPETAWAPATNCLDTAALARGARRAAQSGTALADLATDLAVTIRANAADAAEATAQRAGVLITAPLVLCFLPAFVCLGIVPVIAGLAERIAR